MLSRIEYVNHNYRNAISPLKCKSHRRWEFPLKSGDVTVSLPEALEVLRHWANPRKYSLVISDSKLCVCWCVRLLTSCSFSLYHPALSVLVATVCHLSQMRCLPSTFFYLLHSTLKKVPPLSISLWSLLLHLPLLLLLLFLLLFLPMWLLKAL